MPDTEKVRVLAAACRALMGLEERKGYEMLALDARLAVSLVLVKLRLDEEGGPAYRYAGPMGTIGT